MRKKHSFLTLLLLLSFATPTLRAQEIKVGADHIEQILTLTAGKRVGIATNHTGVLSNAAHTHIIDTLRSRGVKMVTIFTPEHGLRGTADAGEKVSGGRDPKSGLPIISLYGKNRKPRPEQLKGVELMLFDMQDVGVRFYTYISTMYYVISACADKDIPVVILDRPNPHDTVDGPVRKEKKYRSFISLLPIPAVHGLTLGEAALMMNGEGWLESTKKATVKVVKVEGWQHGDAYSLPIAPSPNLKSDRSIELYPTTCFFEPTLWSVARGTSFPFEAIGYPDKRFGPFSFVPASMVGASAPKHKGIRCYGPDLSKKVVEKGINLEIILDAYKLTKKYNKPFFNNRATFNLLAGNAFLAQQLEQGRSSKEIRSTWQKDLDDYKEIRRKYLLYPDYATCK